MLNSSINTSNYGDIESWNNEYVNILLPNTVILMFYLLVGFFGNTLVIIVYGAWRNQSETEEIFMIPILAVCDLLASVILSAFQITLNMKAVTFSNNSACKALCYLNGFLTYLSIFILLIIAIQRYYKLCKPLKQSKMTTSVLKKLITCAILSTAVLASPIAFFYGSTEFPEEGTNLVGYTCMRLANDGYGSYFKIYGSLLILIMVVTIIIFVAIYIQIGRQLHLHFKRHKDRVEYQESPGETNSNDQTISIRAKSVKRQEQRKIKITIIFLVITVLFILCYVPRLTTVMLEGLSENYWKGLSYSQYAALVFVHQIYLINNIVNPVVYAFMDNRFREEAKRVFVKCCLNK